MLWLGEDAAIMLRQRPHAVKLHEAAEIVVKNVELNAVASCALLDVLLFLSRHYVARHILPVVANELRHVAL